MFELDQRLILDKTESVCPICMTVIEARVIVQDGSVFQYKTCPVHGPMIVYLWPDEAHYNWMRNFRLPAKAPVIQTDILKGCPFDCGLCSAHARHPTLAEVEVTYRCNLRCPVCFMSAGDAPEDPSLAQLEGMFASILENSGLQTSLQLTGGEPTIRQDLPEIVRLGRAAGFQGQKVLPGQRRSWCVTRSRGRSARLRVGQLAAVVDQEAAHAGELVLLPRQHLDRELLVGQVGAGELEGLGRLGLVLVDLAGVLVVPPSLELFEALLGLVVLVLRGAS